jgi:hypothetical protein
MRGLSVALMVLFSGLCWGQSSYTVPLEKLNASLAVPVIASRAGVVYAAYRSFDWLRQSDQLRVLAYDLRTRKVLMSGTIAVPKVRGSRASNGLVLSPDGATLAYVEIHEPSLILVLSTKNLSEVRRSSSVPFTAKDYQRQFAGFDGDGRLSFASINGDKPRFVRVSSSDFKIVSEVRATEIERTAFQYVTWNPVAERFWVPKGGGEVLQYTERGQATGEVVKPEMHELDQGAISLGETGVVAFYGQISKGAVASYIDQKTQALELPCAPRPYGVSNDHEYVGAICITQPDRLPEAGGMRVMTSEFLLIRVNGPRIDWRQNMNELGAGDNEQFEWASPVIEHGEDRVWVVAPTQKPELAVYEVPVQK